MNPPSAVLGGVHGKVCWLIAYNTRCFITTMLNPNNHVIVEGSWFFVTLFTTITVCVVTIYCIKARLVVTLCASQYV